LSIGATYFLKLQATTPPQSTSDNPAYVNLMVSFVRMTPSADVRCAAREHFLYQEEHSPFPVKHILLDAGSLLDYPLSCMTLYRISSLQE